MAEQTEDVVVEEEHHRSTRKRMTARSGRPSQRRARMQRHGRVPEVHVERQMRCTARTTLQSGAASERRCNTPRDTHAPDVAEVATRGQSKSTAQEREAVSI